MFGRLYEVVVSIPNLIGIGFVEDTGMIIKNRNECKVIGSGMKIVFVPNNLTNNNHAFFDDNTLMTMANHTYPVLTNEDRFT